MRTRAPRLAARAVAKAAGFALAITLLAAPHGAAPAAADPGDENWSRCFGPPGIRGESYGGTVNAVAHVGTNLYVGGSFVEVGKVPALNVARWDGYQWHALGEGVNGEVMALFDHGALFVGGDFTEAGGVAVNNVARWDGFTWHAVGDDAFNGAVLCFCEHMEGLYIGGAFTEIGGVEIYRVAHWNGYNWEDLPGANLTFYGHDYGEVRALTHFWLDLWAGGHFQWASPTYYHNIACHDGQDWHLPGACLGMNDAIESFVVCDNALWIGGSFWSADGEEADGFAWVSTAGTFHGVTGGGGGVVHALASDGDAVYVAANQGVTPYDAGIWLPELGDLHTAFALDYMLGSLYAGGELWHGMSLRDAIARWDGEGWRRLGAGIGGSFYALTSFDGDLAAGGSILLESVSNDTEDCYHVGLYNGHDWLPLGEGLDDNVEGLAVYDGELHAVGRFEHPMNSETVLAHAARWDGEAWQPLGAGLSSLYGYGYDCCVWEDQLVVVGRFTQAGGAPAARVAAWDGAAWQALGAGVLGGDALAVIGFRGDLIVAGEFSMAGGQSASRIARWDGLAWHTLGSGITGVEVNALATWQGDLYAGGRFTAAGGQAAANLARWDGAAWHAVGGGVAGDGFTPLIDALKGTSEGLFVGGEFSSAGGVPAANVARWTGSEWQPLGSGISEGNPRSTVHALCVHEGWLYVGGYFKQAGSRLSYSIARWNEDMTPVALDAFALRPLAGEVEIRWETPAGAAPAAFRLEARLGDQTWEPAFAEESPGRWIARDHHPALAAGGRATYLLHGRAGGEDWTLLRSESLLLEAVPVAPPRMALHPNPANPRVVIALSPPAAGPARLSVHDVRGRLLAVLHDGPLEAGPREIVWDGTDGRGRPLPSGVYVVRLATPQGAVSGRAVILR